MRLLPLTLAAALATPALAQEVLPPPPPPPADDVPLPPPPPGTSRRPMSADLRVPSPRRPGTIGEAPVAPAGSQAAPLHPDESVSHWRYSLATGVAGKFGGRQISTTRENPGVVLYFAGQADGLWTEGHGQAARLRLRLFSGGEDEIYVPSDGDVEAAYMIGRREFRFVIARLEVGRYPALGVQALAQVATLPCFEGSLSLAGDTMRLYYYLSPVEAAWVRYYGSQHIGAADRAAARAAGTDWPSESSRPVAASAGRLRYTVLLPPSVLLSLQGDLMKMWDKDDLLVSGEGSLGYQVLEQSAVFNVAVRWNGYTRRGLAPETNVSESEVLLLAIASLVF